MHHHLFISLCASWLYLFLAKLRQNSLNRSCQYTNYQQLDASSLMNSRERPG
jgi:hypothetical protein